VPDALRTVHATLRDPRVPARAKAEAAALLAVGLGPWDALPVIGELGLVSMTALALRRLVAGAGEEVVREHWTGTEQGLRVFLALARTGPAPLRLALRLAMSRRGTGPTGSTDVTPKDT
jgi:hypothetical protein